MKFIVSVFLILFSFPAFAQPQAGLELANTVVKSFIEKDFKVLDPFLLNVETAKKCFPEGFGKKNNKEIKDIMEANLMGTQDSWNRILNKTIENGIELEKVKVEEVVVFQISPNNPALGLIAKYSYKGKFYEDFKISVAQVDDQIYFLELPSTTSTLTLFDSGISEFNKAKQAQIKIDTALLEARVMKALTLIALDDPLLFAGMCVYGGKDVTRRGIDKININEFEEVLKAISWQKKLNKIFATCTEYLFKDPYVEINAEGTWYVQPLKCVDGTIVYFSFVNTLDEMLLGDIGIVIPK